MCGLSHRNADLLRVIIVASMNLLLDMLKDGKARSVEIMAAELDTSVEDIERMLEYLENMGLLKRTVLGQAGCTGCKTCSGCDPSGKGSMCKGCIPDKGFQNMGVIWEVNRDR